MDNQQLQNSLAKTPRRHTIEINTPSTLPRFDFILPSYSRDRRLSSIASVIPPETILERVSTNASFTSVEQNPSSSEAENNRNG